MGPGLLPTKRTPHSPALVLLLVCVQSSTFLRRPLTPSRAVLTDPLIAAFIDQPSNNSLIKAAYICVHVEVMEPQLLVKRNLTELLLKSTFQRGALCRCKVAERRMETAG